MDQSIIVELLKHICRNMDRIVDLLESGIFKIDVTQFRHFTIYGESNEELREIADEVDELMEQEIGRNIICYQIIGETEKLPFDCGFITDAALKELEKCYIVVNEMQADRIRQQLKKARK